MTILDYKLVKSEKIHEGKYQILELYDQEFNAWRTCGVYFNKKDALEALEEFKRTLGN